MRSASRKADASGRATSTSVVRAASESAHRGSEAVVVHRQARVRAEARRAVLVRVEERRPRARQLEQAERVARRRRVEDHVIEPRRRRAPASRPANSSNAAISVVHAPESCSRMVWSSSSVFTPPYGAMTRSRYASRRPPDRRSWRRGPVRLALCVGAFPSSCRASRRGSTPDRCSPAARACPRSARERRAHASAVFPTPPLPVKKRCREGERNGFMLRGHRSPAPIARHHRLTCRRCRPSAWRSRRPRTPGSQSPFRRSSEHRVLVRQRLLDGVRRLRLRHEARVEGGLAGRRGRRTRG